eukprot:TRINITY_DN8260_c0_g1_i1.p1 TRINITY_DN8260_c0_g1~~TRINITY_DN8260_c0_g1_i1.p1  ORF type:complete len:373 (-),score=89.00 TRINITY_DN8260_c0_g1_i1:55-1152(-)
MAKIERVTQASFTFKGLIVAENRELGLKLRSVLENICSVIIQAYHACNDETVSKEVKAQKIRAFSGLGPEITFIEDFCEMETKSCKVPSIQKIMGDIYKEVKGLSIHLQSDLKQLNSATVYDNVFENLMLFIRAVHDFMREGHAVEVYKLNDIAQKTIGLVTQLRDLPRNDQLNEFGQFVSKKLNDLIKATAALVQAQHAGTPLETRLADCNKALQTSFPEMVTKTGNKNSNPTKENIAQHAKVTQEVFGTLNKIVQIIEEVKPKYGAELTETKEVIEQRKNNPAKVVDGGSKSRKPGFKPNVPANPPRKIGEAVASTKPIAVGSDFTLEGGVEESKDLLSAAQDMLEALKGITKSLEMDDLLKI